MLKRTISFSNPVYLHTKNEQFVFNIPNAQGLDDKTGENSLPIEDLGIVILDHPQITITQVLLQKLMENNTAVITCDSKHLPVGMFLNLDGNTLQSARFKAQIEATEPLKKQLWQQTIETKIENQAIHLKMRGIENGNMLKWVSQVKSGDSENLEARAAVYYWKKLFQPLQIEDFSRDREGAAPNQLLNYGYAILRACTARALAGSGLLATLGIHHRNQYNAYCLADDIMEPYRIYIDKLVYEFCKKNGPKSDIDTAIKKELLQIPAMDVEIEKKKSPLMVAMQKTTASLVKCYEGSQRKIIFPTMI